MTTPLPPGWTRPRAAEQGVIGFCTCEPGLPMRDCGIPRHRFVAHRLRGTSESTR